VRFHFYTDPTLPSRVAAARHVIAAYADLSLYGPNTPAADRSAARVLERKPSLGASGTASYRTCFAAPLRNHF
jgi:hypothetical protein